MKNIKLFIALSLIITVQFNLLAQKNFEGKIVYGITYDQLPEGAEAMASMLPKETTIIKKGTKTRSEQSVAMMGEMVNISDSKTEKGIMLISMMMSKYAIKKDKTGEAKGAAPKITYINKTKEIAGYKCKLAEVSIEGEDVALQVYYTPNIANTNPQFKGLKGYPLEYQVHQQGMSMTLSATSVSKEKIADSQFEIPEGYELKTEAELQEIMGGMMGQ